MFLEDNLFLSDIQKILSIKEYKICIYKFLKMYSDNDIAKIYGVSRQAINKTVKKIKKKLYDYYKEFYK